MPTQRTARPFLRDIPCLLIVVFALSIGVASAEPYLDSRQTDPADFSRGKSRFVLSIFQSGRITGFLANRKKRDLDPVIKGRVVGPVTKNADGSYTCRILVFADGKRLLRGTFVHGVTAVELDPGVFGYNLTDEFTGRVFEPSFFNVRKSRIRLSAASAVFPDLF